MTIPRSALPEIYWPAFTSPPNAQALAILFQLEQSQWWSPEILLQHQLRQIHLVIKHAAKAVPFYQKSLKAVAELPPGKFTLTALQSLPLLTRTEIQRAGDMLCSRSLSKSHGKSQLFRTSGSSGQPMQAVRSAVDIMFARVLTLRYHLWHQHDFNAKNVSIKTITKMPKGPLQWAMCYPTGSGIVYDIATPVDQLMKRLLEDEPGYLRVHPSTLRGMIKYSQSIGKKPRQLRQVCTFGEVVEDSLRELCQQAWGVAITDMYSAEEMGCMALQCPQQQGYHIQAEHLLIEILNDDNKPCQPGEMGRIIVTQLHNFAMPLIRYDIRDVGQVGEACACGRGLPMIKKIIGRVRNLVTLADGNKIHPVFHEDKMLAIAPITQYQLIQKDLEKITIKLVVTKDLTSAQETELSNYFSTQFKHQFNYHFIYCDDIPQKANGKYEVFRSEVE